MTKFVTSVLSAALLLAGSQAFADDMQKDHMSKDQVMKECMTRMAAKSDGSTKQQMHDACVMEMKNGMHKDGMGKDEMGKDDMNKPK